MHMTHLIPDPQTFGGMLLCAEDTRAYLGRLDVKAFGELRRHPDFPAPVVLTPRRLAWRVSDLDAFISARLNRK